MVGITFDTAKAVRTLRGREHTAEQAEGVVEAIVDAQEGLATKADVLDLRRAMKADLDQLRAEMMAALDAMRSEMKVWTLTLLLGQTILFLSCVAAIEVLAG